MEKIDLILKFYSKDAFVKIKSYDHCIIGIDVQSKRIIYSVNLFIETLKKRMNEQEAIDYFYNTIYEKNIGVSKPIFCEDFFYYDKY